MYVIQIRSAGQLRYLIYRPMFGVTMWTTQFVRATRFTTKEEAEKISDKQLKELLCEIVETG